MRRGERDDDDRPIRRKKRKGLPAWAWPVIALAGLAGLVGLALLAALALAPGRQPASAPRPREEVRKSLEGKTPDEVISAMGRPDRTDDVTDPNAEHDWVYYDRSVDPVSGKVDGFVRVTFRGRRVVRVSFF